MLPPPRLALTFATREVLRLAERVEAVLRFALDMFQADDKNEVAWSVKPMTRSIACIMRSRLI